MPNKNNDILLNKWFYGAICGLFIGLSLIFFFWGRDVYFAVPGYTADVEVFGVFGDFVGGVLGTILTLVSLFLVIKTFRHQQSVTKANEKQLEIQRFNDLFFELLNVYKSQVKELGDVYTDGGRSLSYNDKDFFDVKKELIQRDYRNRKSFEENQRAAIKYYMLFYIENQTKLGAYYRTLYRIYDLIEKSKLDEADKKSYGKILRAQLTDSELFFLRYNALTYYGIRFRKYINKYHVLKHLPAFELLEFKDWWSKLNSVERMGINIVFASINSYIRKNISKEVQRKAIPPLDGKYQTMVSISNRNDIHIQFEIHKNLNGQYLDTRAFDKYAPKTIQRLFDCFLKEIVVYSNFGILNNLDELEQYSAPVTTKEDVIYIDSGIRSSTGREFVFRPYDLPNEAISKYR